MLILKFVALSLVIVAAGTMLVSSADRIGKLTGLGRKMAGFLLLAGATSLPELLIDYSAASLGAVDLALGDLLGSCLFNLLILGVIDLVARSPVRIFSSVSLAHALSAIASIVLTSILALSLLAPVSIVWANVSLGSWFLVMAYAVSIRLIFFDQRMATESAPEAASQGPSQQPSLRSHVTLFCSAALAVVLCAPYLSKVADELAETSGLGGTFVGTILVALTTSLPEIITTLAAVRIGAYELAAGNIFGSNCFNIAIVPIVDFAYGPSSIFTVASPAHAVTASAVILVTAAAGMSLLYRAEKRYWLLEPDALLVVILALSALVGVGLLNG